MAATLSLRAQVYDSGTRQQAHSHDELHLSLVLSGGVTETVGGAIVSAGALSVVVKDPGVVHADRFGGPSTRMVRLSLQGGTFGELLDDPMRCSSWRWTHDATVARPFLRLVTRARGKTVTFSAEDPDLVDLLAVFTARPVAPSRGAPPAWLGDTMDGLRATWHPGLTVGRVAHAAGVHPVYLARCIRRWYGTGLAEQMRRLRLQAAAEAIATDQGTLARIACAGGYADEAHLCREFRRHVGLTPGGYRALVRDVPRHARRMLPPLAGCAHSSVIAHTGLS